MLVRVHAYSRRRAEHCSGVIADPTASNGPLHGGGFAHTANLTRCDDDDDAAYVDARWPRPSTRYCSKDAFRLHGLRLRGGFAASKTEAMRASSNQESRRPANDRSGRPGIHLHLSLIRQHSDDVDS